MNKWLGSQASHIREVLLLEQAQRTAADHPAERHVRLQELWQAARRRTAAARDLRYARQGVASLSLYQQAVAILVTAHLVHRGERDEPQVLDSQAAWTELQRLHGEGELDLLAGDWDALTAWLGESDPLALDRVARSQAHQAREAADALITWLADRTEPRTVRQIRVERAVRLGGLGIGLVVLLGAAVAWAVAPGNVALGKPVQVSSQRQGSVDPAGAVDGELGGTFGFHTNRDHPPWVEIDLETPHSLTEVVVHNRADGRFKDSLPLELWLGTNPGDLRRVAGRAGRFTAAQPWRIPLDGQVARYVRLSVPRRTFLALSEVKVYGKKP